MLACEPASTRSKSARRHPIATAVLAGVAVRVAPLSLEVLWPIDAALANAVLDRAPR